MRITLRCDRVPIVTGRTVTGLTVMDHTQSTGRATVRTFFIEGTLTESVARTPTVAQMGA